MKSKTVIVIMMCVLMLGLFASKAESLDIEKQPSVISAHTSGLISRESMIQVRFAENMIGSDRLNAPLKDSPLTFRPEIKGAAAWANQRTLEFWPKDKLPAGQNYLAFLNWSEITSLPQASETFEFRFGVIRQSFEITVDGLQAASRINLKEVQLTGKLVTADAEDSSKIMKLLRAGQNGKGLNIRWSHSKDRRNHSYIISNILRLDEPSEVILRWDGTAIGANKQGKRNIAVPPIGPFQVTDVRAMHGEQQYIEIRFTDPLEKDQDLNGLIRVSDEERPLRFTIDGSIVRVYSSSPWAEEVTVTAELGIRNILGQRLGTPKSMTVSFEDIKPQARFVGERVIIPFTRGLTLPIETVNLREIIVEAMHVYEENIPQFFQVSTLEEDNEIKRVGRVIWKKTVSLGFTPEKKNQWTRYGLDVSPLVQNNPGGFFRLQLSFVQRHIVYPCPDAENGSEPDAQEILAENNWDEETQDSNWNTYDGDEDHNWWEYYDERENPCHPGYYRAYEDHNISVSRNVLVSDIGLIAKQGGDDSVTVVATDIKTAQPLPDTVITLMDYQRQLLNTGTTDSSGMALLRSRRKPFLLVAQHGGQTGYLKLDDGSALSVSHFDVSGDTVDKGLKGFLYGERGVWRPGDPIYLTFILLDNENRLPKNHPILFELRNPRDQIVKTIKKNESLNGFYSFKTGTDPDAPTGNWTARVRAGGATFEKILKIETIMPNRLKIGLDFESDAWYEGKLTGELSSTWLHGAVAKGLKSDVELLFTSARTHFPKYEAYIFDDPVRTYQPETQTIFEGNLDGKGKATVVSEAWPQNVSPGMLTANFKTRVFEPGGAFSSDRFSIPCYPYERYLGIRTPKGDKARGMLLTDTPHTVSIAMLDNHGEPVTNGEAEIKLYKIKWRWWWEKEKESLAEYVGSSSHTPIRTDKVPIINGKGEWQFEIKYPSWGRYLIRACDTNGDHCTGKAFYIDWPGWAGRAQKDSPDGATVLSFSADKDAYKVGEKVSLSIPTGKKGRGLVSIESGTRVIQTAWIESSGEEHTRYEFPATSAMSPNVYAHVTFLQPHQQTENDLPIRMYGVIPIRIDDPETLLRPLIGVPESFVPEEKAEIIISEADGKPMTYTVAVVDEGLLGLTRFKTPDPRSHFYKKEALGVRTWDIFDMVAGAYSGALEQLLAIGGDDALINKGKKKAHRFPPMVRFIGPFKLGKDEENTHVIDIPQYVGSVRVMVVAGQDRAFGSQGKAVFVRKPLMVLATLPRVLGPDEEVEMPISVFAMDETVKEVSITIETQGPVSVTDSSHKSIAFSEPGDDVITFRLKAGSNIGIASVSVKAAAGDVNAGQHIELDVRMPGGLVTDVVEAAISKGEMWKQAIKFPGVTGSNAITLETARIPPLNLGKRLSFLIRYPHGCVEQTTSAVFPQLYLDKLLELSPDKQDKIQQNVKAGIGRLRTFQTTDGGFAYWPGETRAQDWVSNYAGHFLLEAEKAGYLLPLRVISAWKTYQRKKAISWGPDRTRSELIQAYRLYTLALSGAAELGAMNRLREERNLPTAARWRLASAYHLAGQPEAAEDLIQDRKISISAYRELSNTYGSDLRDKAMILESLCLMGRPEDAMPIAKAISSELGSTKSLSTQTTAYALVAMARHAGISGNSDEMKFAFSWNNGEEVAVSSKHPLVQMQLDAGDSSSGIIVVKNTGDTMLYPRVILEGIPAVGTETAAENGLKLSADYFTLKGKPLNHTNLDQGTDFVVRVTVTNSGHSGDYEEVALSHVFPSGWEIRNTRMDLSDSDSIDLSPESDYDYQDIRDDRVYTYFDIRQGESKIFRTLLNASYLGKFYLPMITAETMYDATINGRIPGEWIQVAEAGEGG